MTDGIRGSGEASLPPLSGGGKGYVLVTKKELIGSGVVVSGFASGATCLLPDSMPLWLTCLVGFAVGCLVAVLVPTVIVTKQPGTA
jgi:hypothetical protein